MAAVLEQLRTDLAARRAAGETFSAAWPRAIAAAVPTPDNDGWRSALHATRDSWRAAYELTPATRSERAVVAAAVDPERQPLEPPRTLERRCAHCGAPIPPARRAGSKYCSREHQRAANGRTLAAA